MKEIWGVPASAGIAIGKVFLYNQRDFVVPEYEISLENVPSEMERYRKAVDKAVADLRSLKESSGSYGDPEGFLDTYILMLLDPDIETRVSSKIVKIKKNVEKVLQDVIDELLAKLSMVEDAYLKERALDIRDISRRIFAHLLDRKGRSTLTDLKEEIILVTDSLLPSDAVAMNKQFVKGLALDAGGKTTHTAILARSFGIPAVLGTVHISQEVKDNDEIVIDGLSGKIVINPSPEVKEHYQKLRQDYYHAEELLLKQKNLPCVTLDGKTIPLNANIEIPEEVVSVLTHRAEGIGLYRSEFLFLEHGVMVGEELQFDSYRRVLEGMNGRPVTIRTLDLGGDKLVPDLYLKESNPLLGWRAIRFCLKYKNIFHTQLRALLRASVYGKLKIMFPMISGVAELEEVLENLELVKQQLRQEEIPFDQSLLVGTMIEVPSAAVVSDHLAQMVDFFSIGTNDLIQYTLAVDRGNERISKLYEPFHPAVLRLIQIIVENAHKAGISVAMCGEMAGDPMATVLLLGLGIDELSMSAMGISKVKQMIRGLSLSEARDITKQVLAMKHSYDIEQFISTYKKGRFSSVDQ